MRYIPVGNSNCTSARVEYSNELIHCQALNCAPEPHRIHFRSLAHQSVLNIKKCPRHSGERWSPKGKLVVICTEDSEKHFRASWPGSPVLKDRERAVCCRRYRSHRTNCLGRHRGTVRRDRWHDGNGKTYVDGFA